MPLSTIPDHATTHPATDDTTDDTAGGIAATSGDTAIGTARIVSGHGPADIDRADATDAGDGGDGGGRPHRCARVDAAFAALATGPDPLSIDHTGHDPDLGLPDGVVSLDALRTWLAAHRRNWAALDAMWRELIVRARLDDPAWVVAATALTPPRPNPTLGLPVGGVLLAALSPLLRRPCRPDCLRPAPGRVPDGRRTAPSRAVSGLRATPPAAVSGCERL
ncbi:hypothetical protein ACQEVZ_27905 [Dactylosporangium sp. CA-152071]|uniref:hypothetical protein n=1 Tax=Dactylosporangium sp. CA-152071 TaxID=3239933 RepID=UPI003D8FF7AF